MHTVNLRVAKIGGLQDRVVSERMVLVGVFLDTTNRNEGTKAGALTGRGTKSTRKRNTPENAGNRPFPELGRN